MLGALIIVFREVIEAGLIVGIVLAAARGVAGRNMWVTIGVTAGVVGAAIVAIFAGAISTLFEGSGQEMFNAGCWPWPGHAAGIRAGWPAMAARWRAPCAPWVPRLPKAGVH